MLGEMSRFELKEVNTNLTGTLPDLTWNNFELVENNPMEQEPENNIC